MNKGSALIIGFGSIGHRHARLLKDMGYEISVVTSRKDCPYVAYGSIREAVMAGRFDFAAVCAPTSQHLDACLELSETGFAGGLFIEKPAFSRLPEGLPTFVQKAYLGYNLRYHPVVQKIRELIAGRGIFSAQLAVGQYLPDWRPGTDYRKSYSASVAGGGGVLRDLSHEIDLANWLFGSWGKLTALCGKWGKLEIEAEDTVDILASFSACPSVAIHLDYHNLFPRRLITIQADGLSLEGDLIENFLRVNNDNIRFDVQRDDTYIKEWRDILSASPRYACSLREGIEVVKFIEAVEKSARYERWEINQ